MLIESKSLLAKLMATENLTVEQRKVSTAYFDTKNRVLVVPILNNDIPAHTYDLFMGHEVGHALWTPESMSDDSEKLNVPFGLVNIVEDSRIERKIKSRYPGLRFSFTKGYADLFDRNFFGVKGINLNTLRFIDRINLHCKGGAGLNIQFSEEEKSLLNEVENTETFQDVLDVSVKIKDFVKEQLKNNPEPIEIPEESDEEQEFEEEIGNSEGFDMEPGDSSDEEDEIDRTGSNPNAEDGEEDESDDEYEDFNGKGDSDHGDDRDLDSELSSVTEENYRQNEYKLFDEQSGAFEYMNIPKVDPAKAILDYKEVYKSYRSARNYTGSVMFDYEGFKEMREDIKNGVSYLVKEFELRKNADQMKKTSIAKTGDLNVNKLFSYRFNEDLFKKATITPGAKNHGLVMFVDLSGSMVYNLAATIRQLFNLVMFCKKVNIPYEVYTFTSYGPNYAYVQKPLVGDIVLGNFRLMNVLSSRMTAKEFTDAAAALTARSKNQWDFAEVFHMNSTPLNESIIAAMEIVPQFQKKNNLQIVNTIFLTDGDADGLQGYMKDCGKENIRTWDYYTKSAPRYIIRDPVTKMQESFNQTDRGENSVTNTLVKLFKARTKSNVVGFYILSPNEFRSVAYKYFEAKGLDSSESRSEFTKNGAAILKNSGFDEYYLLRNKKIADSELELKIDENDSAKKIARQFSKVQQKRSLNRIILSRFINIIA